MDRDDRPFLESNRKTWNNWTELHYTSDFYDVDGFKNGCSTLVGPEKKELTDIAGKTMLHLQCHFGLDTMSWERVGAIPTGVDFSNTSITLAKKLAVEMNLKSRFIQSDIFELKDNLHDKFDIVFTSYGVLFWLNDLAAWAKLIHHFLKPGGIFYMIEFHPFLNLFDEDFQTIKYNYFKQKDPIKFRTKGTYASPDSDLESDEYGWPHSLAEVLSSLIDAGLQVRFMHEFEYSTFPLYDISKEVAQKRFVHPKFLSKVPYMFSSLAVKPG